MAQEAYVYSAYVQRVRWTLRGSLAVGVPVEDKRGKKRVKYTFTGMQTIRDKFLDLQFQEDGQLVGFLNVGGAWQRGRCQIPRAEIWAEQKMIRFLLTGVRLHGFDMPKTVAAAYQSSLLLESMHLQSVAVVPFPSWLEMAVFDLRGAIHVATWQNTILGAHYRYCAREDCPDHNRYRAPFFANRPDQVFCCQYCGHLVSLRNKRAKQRKLKNRGGDE